MDAEGGGDKPLILVKQGAEARVFESTFVGRRSIIKERFSKKYRHPSLDSKLTLKRLNAEARCTTKARRLGVPTPVLYAVDPVTHSLTFEYVEGSAVKDILLKFGSDDVNEEKLNDISTQIGEAVAKLHDGGVVHGDLTTSNMLVRSGTNQLVLIDFGLSFISTLPEDKAVDLYVLERALLSMHSSCGNVMDRVLAAYRKSSKQFSATFNKLAQGKQPWCPYCKGKAAYIRFYPCNGIFLVARECHVTRRGLGLAHVTRCGLEAHYRLYTKFANYTTSHWAKSPIKQFDRRTM